MGTPLRYPPAYFFKSSLSSKPCRAQFPECNAITQLVILSIPTPVVANQHGRFHCE